MLADATEMASVRSDLDALSTFVAQQVAMLGQTAEETQTALAEMRQTHEAALVKGWEELQNLKRALAGAKRAGLLRRLTGMGR